MDGTTRRVDFGSGRPLIRRLGPVCSVLALALSCAQASVADAGVPPRFFGVVSEDSIVGGPGYAQSALRLQTAAGIHLVRVPFYWQRVERAPNQWDFSDYDGYMAAAAARRVRVLPVLYGAPAFRSTAPAENAQSGAYPPRSDAEFADFVARMVRRYGRYGSFWSEHPQLPRMVIRSWQVWNEPNLRVHWRPEPRPAAYTSLLRAAARAIWLEDPLAEVVAAGMPAGGDGTAFKPFVRGMYRAGAGRWFDSMAIHPYAHTARGMLAGLRYARYLLRHFGDSDKPLWVTEYGWASGGPRSPFTTTPRRQARLVRSALRTLAHWRRRLRLRAAIYFNWRDAEPPPPAFYDYWGLHTGLLDVAGRGKPVLRSFRSEVRRLR